MPCLHCLQLQLLVCSFSCFLPLPLLPFPFLSFFHPLTHSFAACLFVCPLLPLLLKLQLLVLLMLLMLMLPPPLLLMRVDHLAEKAEMGKQ